MKLEPIVQLTMETEADPTRFDRSQTPGTFRHAAWLAEGVLLLAGEFALTGKRWPSARMQLGNDTVPVDVQACTIAGANGQSNGSSAVTFLLVRCQTDVSRKNVPDRLILGDGLAGAEFTATELPSDLDDLQTVLRETVGGFSSEARAQVLHFFFSASADSLSGRNGRHVSRSLLEMRQALRERLPSPLTHLNRVLFGKIETFLAVAPNAYYLCGWLRSVDSPITRVTAVSPEGCRIELLNRLFRHRRPDLDVTSGGRSADSSLELGFKVFFESEVASQIDDQWLVEVVNEAGEEIEIQVPTMTCNLVVACNTLLSDAAIDSDGNSGLLTDHIAPALHCIQKWNAESVHIDKVVQYGIAPLNPAVSMIIPIYDRIDLIEQQLAQFVYDPDVLVADIIYVLDSPELSTAIFATAAQLANLYRVPFRVASMHSNAGYSNAQNAGASLARGRLLLLLNSDVLPDRPGWLATMVSFYDSTPRIGALAPKLLYEDEAIQHAGLYFHRAHNSDVWKAEYYYKGLHRSVSVANRTRRVPAVSGACLMISCDFYRELGGLCSDYVYGDYEDADLCLRLMNAGRENWYLSTVELFHLEGQSYPAALRQLASQYNRWLHTQLHGHTLAHIAGRYH